MHRFQDLLAYQKGFELAMEIFEVTRSFPKEEMFSLTDQIRRSSRGTCSNSAEAYRKRRCPKHFISKLSDADTENTETQCWFEFALACNYIDQKTFTLLVTKSNEIGKLIGYMIIHPEKYGSKKLP